MKRILGLDLGIGSIGWALIDLADSADENSMILGIGSRIIPLTIDETTGFTKGNGETLAKGRTLKRGARRGLDRYQQRRKMLGQILQLTGMQFDEELLKLPPLELWKLRSDAANGIKLTLPEIGRVIYHINQRRGYRHSKEESADSKQSDYLAAISGREAEAISNNETPGSYFYRKLKESTYTLSSGSEICTYRIKEKVFPRRAYENELKTILNVQAEFYPEILTEDIRDQIFDIVFYQRPLRSCKHLVSLCEFMSREITAPDGKKILVGPRVAPTSSPIAQICRIWETVNNLELKNFRNKTKKKNQPVLPLFGEGRLSEYVFHLTDDERRRVAEFLSENEKMTEKDLLSLLGLKRDDGFAVDKNVSRGIKGNSTYYLLKKALADEENVEELLRFDLRIEDSPKVDEDTGMVLQRVSSEYLKEPLYRLWHTIYSINNKEELAKALDSKFGISNPSTVDRLFSIDFRGQGYSNKSAKFISYLVPYLQEGLKYSEACEMVGVNHSDSITKEENENRNLLDKLELLPKNSLRQPVVEKILNQMIHQVNAIIGKFGPVDEIRIEMARQLKQGKEERNKDFMRNNAREKENSKISEIIKGYGLKPSRNRIQKYRMWKESEECCMYCGKPIGVREFLQGVDVEKEHVIPRSIFFDDSFSNKVCACRDCNQRKGQMTGYDFMQSEGEKKFKEYADRVDRLALLYKTSKGAAGISKTKRDRLMTSRNEIPTDFVERDLRQSQYIAKKAMSILREVCRNVYASSGSVTDFFRHSWGYDTILHNLNLPNYSAAGQTELVEYDHKGSKGVEERIVGWSKRLDHRHHAIDALTIALTRQGYIQRLNTLNTLQNPSDDTIKSEEGEYMRQARNLDKWAAEQFHFQYNEVREAVAGIAVSFKAGKKVTVPGKRYVYKGKKAICVQDGLLIPRGPLTQESVYGIVKRIKINAPLSELFERPEDICSPKVRKAIEERISDFKGNKRRALNSCKKTPLLPNDKGEGLIFANMNEDIVAIRYKVSAIKYKNLNTILDSAVRKAVKRRFEEVGNSDAAFAKSVAERPVYRDSECRIPINHVRCATTERLDSMAVVRRNEDGTPTGYSLWGNNHHIAIYETPEGKLEESVVPFLHAVQRRQMGLPVVVEDPASAWDQIAQLDNPDQEIISRFPMPDRKFLFSMQQNDMFVIGLSDEEISDCINFENRSLLTSHLYRVQKLSSWNYNFKKHTSTLSDTTNEQMANGNYVSIRSAGKIKELNIRKVRIDRLGNITFI